MTHRSLGDRFMYARFSGRVVDRFVCLESHTPVLYGSVVQNCCCLDMNYQLPSKNATEAKPHAARKSLK